MASQSSSQVTENPFADNNSYETYVNVDSGIATPMEPSSGSVLYNTTGLSFMEQLKLKEEELKRREQELAEKEQKFNNSANFSSSKPANFPPIYPVMYHNIDEEIPESHQMLVRNYLKFWLGSSALLVFNFISCTVLFAAAPSQLRNTIGDFSYFFSWNFNSVIFIIPLSFMLWYRTAYNALMKNNSLYFLLCLFFAGFHTAFGFYMAAGIPGSGAAGFINMLASKAIPSTVLCAITGSLWAINGVLSLVFWKKIHKIYKEGGHTLENARSEVAMYGMSSFRPNVAAPPPSAGNYFRSTSGNFPRPN